MIEENVILVNKNDDQNWIDAQIEAHEKQFASCFSVFVFE
jgi:isopentenyldiphosphate isomerase